MKKWLLILLIILVAASGVIFLLFPRNGQLLQNRKLVVNSKAFARSIHDEINWAKWWPGRVNSYGKKMQFEYNGNTFVISEKKLTSLIVDIQHGIDSLKTELVFIPANADTVLISWGEVNPATASKNRLKVSNINHDIAAILQRMQDYYAKEENIYGLKIKKESVMDSTLISTETTSQGYPSVGLVYGLIDKLKTYATQNDATESGLPMLNIFTKDSINYKVQAALPLNKKLKDGNEIHYRWMLGNGNILVAEVKGGSYTINKGFQAIEIYIQDHSMVAPAISFESLVTDRRAETDTSKWVTKLYWPVM